MENTGIKETMSVAYAEGAVPQMLNGKSYSRAMRSHTIISKALMMLLLQDKIESGIDEEDVALLKGIFEDLLKEDSSVDHLADDDESKRLLKLLDDKYKEAVREQQSSKTSLLWLQYLDMLNILFNYLRSEGCSSVGIRLFEQCLRTNRVRGNNTLSVEVHECRIIME